ncbi:hypothetical protein J437_LFUL004985, partial [Ladona fulva]
MLLIFYSSVFPVELKESSRGKKKNSIRDVPDMFKRYGPIVREEALWNFPVVSVMDKSAVEMVLRGSGGKYPLRPPTEATAYYRKSKPDRYASVGLVNEQGPTWHHLRTTLTPELTSTRTITRFLPEINVVANDFVHLLKKSRDKNHLVSSFEEIANCIGLESTCTLILGRRMGFLENAKKDTAKDEKEMTCSVCYPPSDANLNNIHINEIYASESKSLRKECISSDLNGNQPSNKYCSQGDQSPTDTRISENHREKELFDKGDDEGASDLMNSQLEDAEREKRTIECKDRAFRLASAVRAHFQASRDTYYGLPFWKIIPTPAYSRMAKAEGEIYDIISDLVEQSQIDEEKHNKIQEDKNEDDSTTEKGVQSVFMSVLNAQGLPLREKKAAIIDFIAAGIQTLGNTLVFLLYLISKHKEAQERLYEEVCRLMPNGSSDELTHDNLKDAVYLKACIMEAFRVLPTAPCVARILENEMNLNGFNLPAGTVVLCHTWMACMEESNFKNAKVFSPERWLRDEGGGVASPFLVAPFGCGKRMCPGKRFVEQELQVFLAK